MRIRLMAVLFVLVFLTAPAEANSPEDPVMAQLSEIREQFWHHTAAMDEAISMLDLDEKARDVYILKSVNCRIQILQAQIDHLGDLRLAYIKTQGRENRDRIALLFDVRSQSLMKSIKADIHYYLREAYSDLTDTQSKRMLALTKDIQTRFLIMLERLNK